MSCVFYCPCGLPCGLPCSLPCGLPSVVCCGRRVVVWGAGLNGAHRCHNKGHLGSKLPAKTLRTAITKSEMKRLTQGSLETGLVLYCCSFAIDQLQSSSLQMDMRPVLVDHPLG